MNEREYTAAIGSSLFRCASVNIDHAMAGIGEGTATIRVQHILVEHSGNILGQPVESIVFFTFQRDISVRAHNTYWISLAIATENTTTIQDPFVIAIFCTDSVGTFVNRFVPIEMLAQGDMHLRKIVRVHP